MASTSTPLARNLFRSSSGRSSENTITGRTPRAISAWENCSHRSSLLPQVRGALSSSMAKTCPRIVGIEQKSEARSQNEKAPNTAVGSQEPEKPTSNHRGTETQRISRIHRFARLHRQKG